MPEAIAKWWMEPSGKIQVVLFLQLKFFNRIKKKSYKQQLSKAEIKNTKKKKSIPDDSKWAIH